MLYDQLLREAEQQGIYTYEKQLNPNIKGLYADQVICINQRLSYTEKACVLAEEVGHYYTSAGDILDQSQISNRKQETLARTWGYRKLFPLSAIIQAYLHGVRNQHELASFLGVTEDFLNDALKRYQEIYGICTLLGEYKIHFEPLSVCHVAECE